MENSYIKKVFHQILLKPLSDDETMMEIATIGLPPFLYAPQSAIITETDNRHIR